MWPNLAKTVSAPWGRYWMSVQNKVKHWNAHFIAWLILDFWGQQQASNTMVTEPMPRWWKPLHLQPGRWQRLSRKKSPVCEEACCFFCSLLALRVNGYYGQTNKEKIDDYRRWNLGSDVQKHTCNYRLSPQVLRNTTKWKSLNYYNFKRIKSNMIY